MKSFPWAFIAFRSGSSVDERLKRCGNGTAPVHETGGNAVAAYGDDFRLAQQAAEMHLVSDRPIVALLMAWWAIRSIERHTSLR